MPLAATLTQTLSLRLRDIPVSGMLDAAWRHRLRHPADSLFTQPPKRTYLGTIIAEPHHSPLHESLEACF
jgi:hypothetical protein